MKNFDLFGAKTINDSKWYRNSRWQRVTMNNNNDDWWLYECGRVDFLLHKNSLNIFGTHTHRSMHSRLREELFARLPVPFSEGACTMHTFLTLAQYIFILIVYSMAFICSAMHKVSRVNCFFLLRLQQFDAVPIRLKEKSCILCVLARSRYRTCNCYRKHFAPVFQLPVTLPHSFSISLSIAFVFSLHTIACSSAEFHFNEEKKVRCHSVGSYFGMMQFLMFNDGLRINEWIWNFITFNCFKVRAVDSSSSSRSGNCWWKWIC